MYPNKGKHFFSINLEINVFLFIFRLRELANVDLQRLHAMERWDKDTHDAIVWVRNNRHLFRMEVYETPFMRIAIKDKKYTNAVEACFSVSQMRVR